MKILNLEQLRKTNRNVKFNAGNSIRFLLESDGMGFSFHQTEMPKSKEPYVWHYKNHLECCYCIQGFAIITDLTNGTSHEIRVGDMYVLDAHQKHSFLPLEDTILISVFNPPVTGNEVHQEDGSYSIIKQN
jgi:L-ectoine synthase